MKTQFNKIIVLIKGAIKNPLQYKVFYLLLIIFLVGTFLRVYHFSDWLHFQLDQSRDAYVIDEACQEGIGHLPLLGPRAGGSFLRLGPAFYYLEYLSAQVFGDTPTGIAVIVLLLALASIPLFYFFSRYYFSQKISLILTLLYSFSFYFVMFSRYAWNPNPLPFFTLLTFYSLLRATRKNIQHKMFWFSLTAISLAITTQLHFLSFIIVPAVVFFYLIFRYPRTSIKYWVSAILLIILFYSPVIINEIKTGGKNTEQFWVASENKSHKKGKHNLAETVARDIRENALWYTTIVTGNFRGELPKFKKITWTKIKFKQVKHPISKINYFLGVLSLLFFLSGLFLLLKNFWQEKNKTRKDFLTILVLWFTLSFLLFAPISYDMSARFFLTVSVLPLFLLGFIFELIDQKIKANDVKNSLLIMIVLVLLISNAREIRKRFTELANVYKKPVHIESDKILNERYRVTLQQQKMIVDYILQHRKDNFTIALDSQPFYKRSLSYLIDRHNIPRIAITFNKNRLKCQEDVSYWLILPTDSNMKSVLKKYKSIYKVEKRKSFGTMQVFHLKPYLSDKKI